MDMDIYHEKLKETLQQYEGLEHLHVKKYGKTLIIYSDDKHDAWNHARLTFLKRNLWGLSFPRHTGRWERTPIMGTMEDVVSALINDFGFYLAHHESNFSNND
jgi:hypothetical protein